MTISDVISTITEFIVDDTRTSIQLPIMTAEERKQAKRLVERYAELRCESYGFGADRQLHVFKTCECKVAQTTSHASIDQQELPTHAIQVKNTFIDGWGTPEFEPAIFRSLQVPLGKNDLYLHSAKNRERSPDCSTASGEEAESIRSNDGYDGSCLHSSPDQEPPSVLDVAFQTTAQVRNTFVNFDAISMDERIVQSMPHGMFGQCLSNAQITSSRETAKQETCAQDIQRTRCEGLDFVAGALVVIQGLVKAPAFNGHSAMVQGWDTTSERYSVLITSSAFPQQAKIKAENLQLISCP